LWDSVSSLILQGAAHNERALKTYYDERVNIMKGILGKKLGMTAIYGELGTQIPVTAVYIGGNKVVGKRTQDRDGYTALILGFGKQKLHRLNKPALGFLKKQGIVTDEQSNTDSTVRHLREFRMSATELESFEVGQDLKASDFFTLGEKIDVAGTSKGRGFTGVMKRHNFSGTKASHGVHEFFRHGGSIGCATYPARVFKNKKMPGQHGNARTTIQNLLLASILDEENIVLIRGGLPGPNGGIVEVKKAVKGRG
jgi:large subunit ribosomal protein L3